MADDSGSGGGAGAGASAAATAGGSSIAPNHTLYVNNLNEKLKVDKLKVGLYAAFIQFGTILEIVASKSLSMRGQAWIVFDDVGMATSALRAMQGFDFFGKPLRLAYAKVKSDAIAKRDGSWKPRPKRARDEDADMEGPEAAAGSGGGAARSGKRAAASSASAAASSGAASASASAPVPKLNPPHSKLLAQNIPAGFSEDRLRELFSGFAGFKEMRPMAARNLAFIEYETEANATIALQGLNNYNLDEAHPLVLSYARK